jgi:hypothetical protein
MILKWFQSLISLLISRSFLHLACAVFLLLGLYIVESFSASVMVIFLSHEIATSINIHINFQLWCIIMSGILLGMVLSTCTCSFHNMVTLHSRLVSANCGTCPYRCSLSNIIPISWHMLKCSWAHTLSSLYVLFLLQYWAGWCDVFYGLIELLTICICYLFQFLIVFLRYFVRKDWPCVAIISLSVSAFTSLFDSHSNVLSSLISYLSTLLMYWPYITLPFFFLRTLLILLLCVVCLPLFCSSFHLTGLILLQHVLLSYLFNSCLVDSLRGFQQYFQTFLLYILCSDILQCWPALVQT